MKLLRYIAGDEIRPAMLDSAGGIRDLGAIVPDIDGETKLIQVADPDKTRGFGWP